MSTHALYCYYGVVRPKQAKTSIETPFWIRPRKKPVESAAWISADFCTYCKIYRNL